MIQNTKAFNANIEQHPQAGAIIVLSYTPVTGPSITARIAPEKGSNMFSLVYDRDELIYSDPETLKNAGFTGTYVLFPTPNRVRNFTYTWNGITYTLTKRGKPADIHHQFVYDQVFIYSEPIISEESASVTTEYVHTPDSDTYPGYPFPCVLRLTYTLKNSSIEIAYGITNTGKSPLPFGFGLHPHFRRLSGNDGTFIRIPANVYMESEPETLLPTGKLIPVSKPDTDAREAVPAGTLNLDHVFTSLESQTPAYVDYTTLKKKVELSATDDCTHLVVYTGHPEAICIENQTCSTDAINLHAKGFENEAHVLTVAPAQTHFGTIQYTITSY